MVKERRSETELRQMMLAAARNHEECSELDDLFIFGPTPRPDANWGFGIAGKDNKVSVACYSRLDQIASDRSTQKRTVAVHTRPQGKGKEALYATVETYLPGQAFPVVIDGREVGRLNVSDLFPPEPKT